MMWWLRFILVSVGLLVGFGAYQTGKWFVQEAQAQPTLTLPFATVTSLGASSAQIIPANASRRSIQICNPSATLLLYIAPLGTTPTSGGSGVSVPANSCFTPPANVLSSGSAGGGGAGWNGIMSGAGPTSVIVLEW